MRRLITGFLLSTCLLSSFAGTYGHSHGEDVIVRTCYRCGWQLNPQMRYLTYALRQYHIKTLFMPYSVRIVVPDYLIFKGDTDDIYSESYKPIQLLSYMVNNIPFSSVRLIGYSDDAMGQEDGKKQALHRAQVLAGRLWETGTPGIGTKLSYTSRGEKNPISDNQFIDDMNDNRRIEILIKLPTN